MMIRSIIMKKILFLLVLIMTLSLSLFACGGGGDDEETIPEPEVQADLPLFVNGEATFSIVMANDLPSTAKSAVRALEYTLNNKFKKNVTVDFEGKFDESDIEILIGNIKSRGDKYFLDGHSLGNDGYAIKLVDTKVLINGGSAESVILAIEKFGEDILGIENNKIADATMRAEDSFEFIQTDFDITALKIDGTDIRSFKICANLNNKTEKKCAEQIRDTLYLSTGAYLEITSEASGENLIHIKTANDGNFTVNAANKKLTISYSHENLLETMVANFLNENIIFKRGELSFSGEVYKKDTSVVYYEYFGAVGDGKTDDFEAIFLAHEAANQGGQTVKATSGKTYYIKDASVDSRIRSVTVKTNVDWAGAKFIIDDTGLIASDQGKSNIFKVVNDDDRAIIKITDKVLLAEINAGRIGPGTDKIEIPKDAMQNWDGPVMVVLYNSSHAVYRRRGYGGYTGETQKELVILDENGNLSDDTPIMFDYKNLTQLDVYRLDPSRAITIEGGEFTTIASRKDTAYISRNISINRSYTTLRGVKHYVEGELELYNQFDKDGNKVNGACYSAFYAVGSCTDVTLENCVLTGRRDFNSSYEFSASTANNVKLLGCTQSNFWVTVDENYEIHPATKDTPGAITSQGSVNVNGTSLPLYWGAGASNYCKNLKYIDTQLSRYDAHAGVYNGEIIGCEITGIELTGWGELTIEDTEWHSYGSGAIANSLIYLRNDYGSTWNGTIKIKDVEAYYNTTKQNDSYIFYHSYVNWYFGYTVGFPNVEIDNLKCYDRHTKELLDEGYEILLTNGSHINASTMFHLPEGNIVSNYSIVDADKDGFVDEPIMDRNLDGRLDEPCDLDGDGKPGNTSIPYADAKANAGENIDKGTTHPGSLVNLNIVKPPEYIKILNNTGKGSFTLKVKNTAGSVSNGGYYGAPENNGGFFGSTKFYYSENKYFVGTNQAAQQFTSSFLFYN